jgi:hypothetical protein
MSRDKAANLRQSETVAEAGQRVSPSPLARTLSEVKDILRRYEATALADVAQTLAEAAESLAHTARELHEMRSEEWMTPEQMAARLGMSKRGFERIAPYLPRRYISRQVVRYPRSLVDEAIDAATSPEQAVVENSGKCRHADKSSRAVGDRRDTGAARSLKRALENS